MVNMVKVDETRPSTPSTGTNTTGYCKLVVREVTYQRLHKRGVSYNSNNTIAKHNTANIQGKM